jgi:diguanylate cyclase (GGDEF)-like protein
MTLEPMAAFLAEQSDFILFFYGLAFVLLGITCFAIAKHAKFQSWHLLGLFGVIHGCGEWLDLSALVVGDTLRFATLRTTAMTVSYLFLMEFARLELARHNDHVPGRLIYLPLVLLVVVGGLSQGISEANALARYTFGLFGALGTSFVFAVHSKQFLGPAAQRFALVAAAGFALYAVAAGAIVPNAPFWPADVLNQDWFLRVTGVPIQLVRGVLACGVAIAIWGIWGQKLILEMSSARYTRFLHKQFAGTVATMTAILLLGWALTEYFGIVHKQQLQQETLGDLDLLATSLSGETAPVDAVVRSLAGSPTVRAALTGEGRANSGALQSVLDLDVKVSGAQRGYILDAAGTLVASSDNEMAPPDTTSQSIAVNFPLTIAGHAGHHFAYDPARKEVDYSTSYPVRGPAGKVVGVAVLERSLNRLRSKLSAFNSPFFLIDANGVIALTNRPNLLQHTMWPLAAETHRALAAELSALSGPIVAEEIEDGTWATVAGEPMYVRRLRVDHSNWSLVVLTPVEGIFASRVLGIAITLLTTIMVLIYVVARERAVHDHVQMDRRVELEELARILDQKATTDPLTGLANRLKFDEVLAREVLRARRFKTPLSLIMYDIDHFKQVNDNHGHQVGDIVLIRLSRSVSARMRATDLLARWGGEEFAIITPQSDAHTAARFAEILKTSIEAASFDHAPAVTCSFGVAQLAAGESANGFVARADEALYRAKIKGRNRVELASNPGGADAGVGSAA